MDSRAKIILEGMDKARACSRVYEQLLRGPLAASCRVTHSERSGPVTLDGGKRCREIQYSRADVRSGAAGVHEQLVVRTDERSGSVTREAPSELSVLILPRFHGH